MFGYYLGLALRSLKRNRVLTALMVLAIGLGIGASMTMLTVLHVLSGDPLPGKSAQVYRVQIDPQNSQGYRPGLEPPKQVTWTDGMSLLRAKRASGQVLMTGGSVPIQPVGGRVDPFLAAARFTTAGIFAMFHVPFLYGHPWNAKADNQHARVVVISRKLNEKLFGGADSTGKMLHIGHHPVRIIGVADAWAPHPRFYDLSSGAYSGGEKVFLPLSTSRDLKLGHVGSTDCWGSGRGADLRTSQCTWLQFWVELDSPAKVTAYRKFLVDYSKQQKALGRFQRPPNVRLRDVMQWLNFNRVVPDLVRVQTWLAFGFLIVCLINTLGLLLARFLRRASTLGIHRAMGASRRALFAQLLVEAGVIGVWGAALGLLLAFAGLWLVRRQPMSYASLAHMDPGMLVFTVALAIGASLLAGVLPAWRACRISPSLQIKES